MLYKERTSQRKRLLLRVMVSLVVVSTIAMGCTIAVIGWNVLEAFQHPDSVTVQDISLGINIFRIGIVVWVAMFVVLALGATYFKRKDF